MNILYLKNYKFFSDENLKKIDISVINRQIFKLYNILFERLALMSIILKCQIIYNLSGRKSMFFFINCLIISIDNLCNFIWL